MPQRDFELYLSLLSRFLRLDAAQREQIADELRDHFEERYEELLESGLSREEAIRATLEEFGDAAGLAAHFSHIGNRRRRMIMRYTLGTAAGLMAAVFLAATFWPEMPPAAGPARAVAQQPPAAENARPPQSKPAAKSSGTVVLEAKFEERRLSELDFVEIPLTDVLGFLCGAYEVDFLLDKHALTTLGVTADAPITLQVKRTSLTFRTSLELVLEQVDRELGFTVRDGLIYVTRVVGKPSDFEIQIYNVRDILKSLPSSAVAYNPGPPGSLVAPGGEGASQGLGGMGGGVGHVPTSGGSALLRVIRTTIYPNTWEEVGGDDSVAVFNGGGEGSVAEFNGLLIIRQSQAVHQEIARLLIMMREVDQIEPQPIPRPRR